MKKAILTLCCVVMVTLLSAQSFSKHSFTVNTQLGVGNIYEVVGDGPYTNFNPNGVGLVSGAAVLYGFHFNPRVSLQSGLAVASYKAKGRSFFFDGTYKLTSAEVPLYLRYKFTDTKWAPYVQMGAAFSMLINEIRVWDEGGDINMPAVELPFINFDRVFNLSAHISAGVEYELSQRFFLFGGLGYNQMLLSSSKYIGNNHFIWSANANLGIKVHLGK